MSSSSHSSDAERDCERQRLRALRRGLSAERRREAELEIAARLRQLRAYRRAVRIGVYFAVDGEVQLGGFIADARRRGKQVYAPIIEPDGMRFALTREEADLAVNRFGIPEPRGTPLIELRMLDLVVTPLVGFDPRGTRLGMGGGYYDRSFGFLKHRTRWLKPKLVGVGFSGQRLAAIDARPWDVRLCCAVTEDRIEYFGRSAGP